MSQPSPPSQPNPANTYAQGLQTFMKYLPLMLQKEYAYRGQYDPKFIQQQLDLQKQFGSTVANLDKARLDEYNPYFNQVYGAMGKNILAQMGPNNPYVNQANQVQNQAFQDMNLGRGQALGMLNQAYAGRNLGQAQANQAANQAFGDLKYGTQLDPAFQTQLQSQIRAAEAARGNVLGGAPISAETMYQGQAAQNLYNTRLQRALSAGQYQQGVAGSNMQRVLGAEQGLQGTLGAGLQRAIGAGQYAAGQRQIPLSNAGQFLGTTSPIQQIAQIAPVQAPDAFRLMNPNAGYLGQQIGQQGYQNALAAYGMGNQGGGWMGALTGALGGAGQGAQFGGGYGAAAGALLGGFGGYFSDARLKENITYTGEQTKDGIPVVEFYYKGHSKKLRGVIAQDVLKVRPDAVFPTSTGYLGVRYDRLGIQPKVVG